VLRELRAATASVPHSGMQIGADQGQFMAILVKLMGAKRCLEIGTYTGYSALAVALALPKDGKIVCCDVSEEWTAVGKPFWKKAGVEKKIDLRIGPALRTLEQLKKERKIFDFVFVDADKPNYLDYYERCLKLLRRGGLIMVDNVLWSGEVANPEARDELTLALRKFNERVYSDKRVEIAMLSVGDGVTLALKK
jgi:predicted O-methyltransferase YrrM